VEGSGKDPLGLVKKNVGNLGTPKLAWDKVQAAKVGKWPRIQKKTIAIVWGKILSVNEDIDLFLLVGESVATPLWPSVGVKPNTCKVGDLESFETPECSELDNKAKTTLY
jgi:hypothetical protein